jgi:hypothetical protein
VHPLPPLSTVVEYTPTRLGPNLPTPPLSPLPEDSEILMRSLVLRIENLESQYKASNNFIQKMFSQQQVMQAENIALDADNAVLKKDITQVNLEGISILAKLKELSREPLMPKEQSLKSYNPLYLLFKWIVIVSCRKIVRPKLKYKRSGVVSQH